MPRLSTDSAPIALIGNGRGVIAVCPGFTVASVVQSTRREYGWFSARTSRPR